MFRTIFLILLGIHCSKAEIQYEEQNSDDITFLINLVVNFGYPLEIHTVTTEDDYILKTFRIPYGRNTSEFSANETGKPVVFLMHSMVGSCYEYMLAGPSRSLAFLLADRGFDVWMGNNRGNFLSKGHKYLNSTRDRKYWQYSWNEMGMYDLPANIDYIINVTGQPYMDYVGMSQGTTVFFVMGSERPEYNKYIRNMIAMGPTVYLGHTKAPIKFIGDILDFMKWLANFMQIDEIFPRSVNMLLRTLLSSLCQVGTIFQETCIQIMFFPTGFDAQQFNKTLLPHYFRFAESGFSVRQIFHYGQLMKSGNFEKYDFGRRGNQIKYHSNSPPKYNLSRIDVAVTLFYGDKDVYSETHDLKRLENELPNSTSYEIPFKEFAHVDFIAANEVVELVYNKIFELFTA